MLDNSSQKAVCIDSADGPRNHAFLRHNIIEPVSCKAELLRIRCKIGLHAGKCPRPIKIICIYHRKGPALLKLCPST